MGVCFICALNFVPLFVPPRLFAAIEPGLACSRWRLTANPSHSNAAPRVVPRMRILFLGLPLLCDPVTIYTHAIYLPLSDTTTPYLNAGVRNSREPLCKSSGLSKNRSRNECNDKENGFGARFR